MLAALLALVLLATVALGFQVFSAAPGRQENRAFALFTWLMALWIVNDLVFWGFHSPDEDGRTWANTALTLAIAIQLAFLWFAWVFPINRAIPWRLVALGAAPVLGAFAVVWSGHAVGEIGFVEGQFQLQTNWGTYLCGLVIYALFGLGRVLLARSRRSIDDRQLGFQLDTLAFAAWTTGGITNIVGVVLPLLGVNTFLPLFSLGILLGCIIHAYAILNFKLFQPASVLDRLRLFPVTAKLSFSIALASLGTVLLVLSIARLVLNPADTPGAAEAWKRVVVFSLIASSVPVMALIFTVQNLVTRPLRMVTETALRVADGETEVRVEVGARDEFAVLAKSFNDMVQRLASDMENLRALSEGLLRTERLASAGALAAGVAHEVNNPLAVVSSLLQMISARSRDAQDQAQLEQAIEQMDRVAAALRDLMELARPREEQRRECRLIEILEKTSRLLRYDPKFKKLRVEIRNLATDQALELDPDRLQQVFLNLFLNARDALEAASNPQIVVSLEDVERSGRAWQLVRIQDNGPGVPDEAVEKIFEPFFTTKAPGAGTGLGLAVCRDIIQSCGGRLALERSAGLGACFVIELPMSELARGGA